MLSKKILILAMLLASSMVITSCGTNSNNAIDATLKEENTRLDEQTKETQKLTSEDITVVTPTETTLVTEGETTVITSEEKTVVVQEETTIITSDETTIDISKETTSAVITETLTKPIEKETVTEPSTQKPTDSYKEQQTTTQKQTDSSKEQQTTQNIKDKFNNLSKTDKFLYVYKNNDKSLLDSDELKEYNVLEKVVKSAQKQGNAYAQEKYVYEWIIRNCEYDYNAAEEYRNSAITSYEPFSSFGVFVNGYAVCEGYAEAFKLCMDLLEIPCIFISGSAYGEPHGWNAVCLDDEWYQVDVTWDDPGEYYGPDEVHYEYFNVTDEIMKKEHTYSCDVTCNSTKYWYIKLLSESTEPLVFTDIDEAVEYIKSMLKDSKYNFSFSLVDLNGNVDNMYNMLDKKIDIFDFICNLNDKITSVSISKSGNSFGGDYAKEVIYDIVVE